MPRKPFQCDPTTPYNLSGRANNRDWFALPMDEVWKIFSHYLFFIHHAYRVQIHAFVLMDNHFHLMASFPEGNLSEAMLYFMRETSRAIAKQSGRINHVFGTRVFRSRLGCDHYFQNAYKYNCQNPVRAGICEAVESYRFSTVHGLLGLSHLLFPVLDRNLFEEKLESRLSWLNQRILPEDCHDVRNALKRPDFKLTPETTSRKRNRLEDRLI